MILRAFPWSGVSYLFIMSIYLTSLISTATLIFALNLLYCFRFSAYLSPPPLSDLIGPCIFWCFPHNLLVQSLHCLCPHHYLSISLISIPFRYITIIICRYFPTYLYACQNSYSSVAHRLFTQKYWAICFLWYNIITPICPTLIIHNLFLFSNSLTQFHYSYSTPMLSLFTTLLYTILSTLICFL